MVLNMFGNVSLFGRSKKPSSTALPTVAGGSPSTSRRAPGETNNGSGSEGEAEGFLVVNQSNTSATASAVERRQSSGVYPTILTDEMLRSPTSGAPLQAPSATSTWNSHHQPFSQQPGHQRQPSLNATPMDNVPFSPSAGAASAGKLLAGSQMTDLGKCFQVVDRIGLFLSTPSQSDYNFSLENSVVRESQAFSSFQ